MVRRHLFDCDTAVHGVYMKGPWSANGVHIKHYKDPLHAKH